MFQPKNALEILTVRAFLSYLDKGYGILPLRNSIFAVAYEIYVRDFYDAVDYDVTDYCSLHLVSYCVLQ